MLWSKRAYDPRTDENALVYLWLKSFAHSSYGVAAGAHRDASTAELAYWARHRLVVMPLLESCTVEILCDPEDPNVIWAFAATKGNVVHYVCVKRTFHKEGVSADMVRDLLGDRLTRPCLCSHELPELRQAGLDWPTAWTLDPYAVAS